MFIPLQVDVDDNNMASRLLYQESTTVQRNIFGLNFYNTDRFPENKAHTMKKNTDLNCPFCGRTLASRASYNYHIRTHTGETNYSCPHCSYKCILKSHLQSHLKIHTGEKPFSCPYCSYQTAWKSNLQSHIMTHSDKLPLNN